MRFTNKCRAFAKSDVANFDAVDPKFPIQDMKVFYPCGSTDNALGEIGLVNYHAWNTDQSAMFPSSFTSWSDYAATGYRKPDATRAMGLKSNEYSGRVRLIAAGFELLNTTSQLNKQGTISAVRIPQQTRTVQMRGPRGGNSYAAYPVSREDVGNEGSPDGVVSAYATNTAPTSTYHITTGPPPNLDELMSYPRAVNFPAEHGAYAVMTMNPTENPLDLVGEKYQCIATADTRDKTLNNNEDWQILVDEERAANCIAQPNFSVRGQGSSNLIFNSSRVVTSEDGINAQLAPIDTTSIYATGLSKETTMTLILRYTLEIAANPTDIGFGTLSRSLSPTATYDPEALLLYARMIEHLPSAVPRSMNPSGEFWDMLCDVVDTVASPVAAIASLVPGIGAPIAAVANGVKALSGIARSKLGTKPQQTAAKPAQQRAIAAPAKVAKSRALNAPKKTSKAQPKRIKR